MYYNRALWRHKHPALARLAAVHHGFQSSWTRDGFNARVLEWVGAYHAQHPGADVVLAGRCFGITTVTCT